MYVLCLLLGFLFDLLAENRLSVNFKDLFLEMCAALSVPIIKSDYKLYPSMPTSAKKKVAQNVGPSSTVGSFSNPDMVVASDKRNNNPSHHHRTSVSVPPKTQCHYRRMVVSASWQDGSSSPNNNNYPCESENLDPRLCRRGRRSPIAFTSSLSASSDEFRQQRLRQILAQKARQQRGISYSETAGRSNDYDVDDDDHQEDNDRSKLSNRQRFFNLLRHIGFSKSSNGHQSHPTSRKTSDEMSS
uniref:Uncharacterized protein n=1 Tax=Romanomermis culicivorax TaxID=13658 RepID=A0A915L7B2_ROMCU